jgi:hypothetical protein
MRVQFVVNGTFVDRVTDAHGIVRWNRSPRPVFGLAQWGSSYAFVSFFPQAPLPNTIVGVRTDVAVVHAGDSVRIVGFARTRSGSTMRVATGSATVSMRLAGTLVSDQRVELDGAGAFTTTIALPPTAQAGDYAVLAEINGAVGSASVHVDADANGLSLNVASRCDNECDPNQDVPVEISASRGDVPVQVTVVRSPHVFVNYVPDGTPWATTTWLSTAVTTDGGGHATLLIPRPTDGLSSTYGVRVVSGGATADTRIVVPTARAAVRLHLDSDEQTLGTPVGFDVYANDVASGAALKGATVTMQLQHGSSVQQQSLVLDADGHARGAFTSAELGTNLVFASVQVNGAVAMDAAQAQIVPEATSTVGEDGSGDVHIGLDRALYRNGENVNVNAQLGNAQGDALLTLESALGSQSVVTGTNNSHADAQLRATDALGEMRIGAAFVRDGALEWASVPLALNAPGRPDKASLVIEGSGSSATLHLDDALSGAGTIVVRVSRGDPSGSALFETAPALMAVGLAATQDSAQPGTTSHPWVDSTGEHAQVVGFERRTQAPADVTLAESDAHAVLWTLERQTSDVLPLQLPTERGRYTVSVLKISDDGRVTAASSIVMVQ